MYRYRIYILITTMLCLSVMSQTAKAQDDTEDWLQNGRPECVGEPAIDGARHIVRRIGSQATAPIKARGIQHVPVVLVAFQDKDFTVGDSLVMDTAGNVVDVMKGTDEDIRNYYRLFCNGRQDGVRYTGHGSYGSVHDYFVEQSDSVFLPQFTVIGPVTLDNGYAYYGANRYNSQGVLTSHHKNISEFYRDALGKAYGLYPDWKDFDNNGDGNIDIVFFIFAGLGESNGGDTDCLWPHETTRPTTINGTVFSTTAITCESRPATYRTDTVTVDGKATLKRVVDTIQGDGIGVFIHELSHALGLPDFYDTEYVAFGMDLWSVMDYGEYGGNGYVPGNYTAYERDFMGWQPLEELTGPCVLTIPCFADGGKGYRIVNEANPDEYYIIENRQPRGWDRSVCAQGRHGLQVTHVDYLSSRWNANTVNTDTLHQRMTIIAANNRYIGTNSAATEARRNGTKDTEEWVKTLNGNLWPGDQCNYSLTDESTPAAEVYTGGLMHKPLRNITENLDGTVTVCFCTNGILEPPEVRDAENIGTTSFDAVWGTVEHATRYVCELYEDSVLLLCDTLTENVRHYGDLQVSKKMKYRVMAMADMPDDYLSSGWSDFSSLNFLIDLIPFQPCHNEKKSGQKVYDLCGREISRPKHGLYVRNGKIIKM
ncbi:MAG: M6 family metalloprotease domain-containing protein [Bacteroidaceae bacterium]|nr:M6 family metalloprotease domain-containing protein [Bacteroidaceae bacterium]